MERFRRRYIRSSSTANYVRKTYVQLLTPILPGYEGVGYHSSFPPTLFPTFPFYCALKFWSRWKRPAPNCSYTLTSPPPASSCCSIGSRVKGNVSLLQLIV